MENLLIALVIINLVLVLFLLFKKEDNTIDITQIIKELSEVKQGITKEMYNNKNDNTKYLNHFKEDIVKFLSNDSKESLKFLSKFKEDITKNNSESTIILTKELTLFRESIYKNIDDQMEKINKKVELRLEEGFKNTNKTFINILERLTKIDEAQKQIEKLSTNIISLQDVLGDKKSRGIFGEVQLKNILSSIFGEKNDKIYEMQKHLSNSTLVDAMLHAPSPLGSIGIDSKFPLENYKRLVDKSLSDIKRKEAEKNFINDLKKHIDAIASKYIIKGETSDQAILFLPAEAIFAEINAYHPKIIEYSQQRRVWITSPTTIMSTLTTIQVILNNLERDKHAQVIQQELNKLGTEFGRFKERWVKLERNISTVSKTVNELNTTSNKITNRFDSISKVELSETKELE